MDHLFNLRAFACVAQTGSFTAAARQLELTTAYVSRAVSQLEQHLQTRLLHRTTRQLRLTEAGERYLVRCERILADLDDADAEARYALAVPRGRLRIHTMTGLGQHYLIQSLAGYRERFPEVDLDLQLTNTFTDILKEGYDLSLILADGLADSAFHSVRLGSTHSVLCAAPGYLDRLGRPATPAELVGHRCLRLVNRAMAPDRWLLEGPEGIAEVAVDRPPFQVNTADALAEAVANGLGIGALPLYAAVAGLASGRLQRVLPRHRLYGLDIHALYPSRRFLDAKIRTLVDHLRETLPTLLERDRQLVEGSA